jgi:hypothetical protein
MDKKDENNSKVKYTNIISFKKILNSIEFKR